jgi:hexokinase
MTSAMYLGEIVRNVITSLIDYSPPLLFGGRSSRTFNTPYGLDAEQTAMIHSSTSLEDIKQVLAQLGFDADAVTDQDARIVKSVCAVVGKRAARLAGCSIAAALIMQGRARLEGGISGDKVVIAAEGK